MRSPATRQATTTEEETTRSELLTEVFRDWNLPVNSNSERGTSTTMSMSDDSQLEAGSVVDAVNHLEQLLGYKLNATVSQVGDTTKILVEMDKLEIDKPESCAVEETTAVEIPASASGVLEGGTFHTQLARHHKIEHRQHDRMFIKYATRFSDPPSIILAINSLEVDRCANVRVSATTEDIHEHIFGVLIHSWGDTRLYSAGCTWLAVPRGHPHFQLGTFSTGEDHHWSKPQHLTHRGIVFNQAYQAPPKVVVWLSMLDFTRHANERVMAFATDITATGFTVHINSWGDTKLHGARISWFAYPAGFPGICSGVVLPEKGTSGVVKFERKFAKPPTFVLVGLNKLESDRQGRCSFHIFTDAVSEIGMGIRVEGWGDTILHSAGVAYLAIE